MKSGGGSSKNPVNQGFHGKEAIIQFQISGDGSYLVNAGDRISLCRAGRLIQNLTLGQI